MKQILWSCLAVVLGAAVLFATGAAVPAPELDESIGTAFRETYVYKTYLKDDSVTAEANDGVVTLTGTVEEGSHRMLAQETASSLPGVTRVDNQLITASEADAENRDAWIARRLKLVLMFHRNVNAGATTVEVADGVVKLSGEADSEAQKVLTEEYAADIEGVTGVKNEMTVAAAPVPEARTMGEKLDDMSITAQVRTALLTHRSTSAIKTGVVTLDGAVTLTGVAQSESEKVLAGKLVADINGVTGVSNEMTVEEVVVQ